jgi:hypothetical protein
MDNKNTFDKLVSFIIREYWGNKDKMNLNTTIEKDLGITGTDGIEFLEKFLSHFNIDYQEDREWQTYFGSEGLILFFDWRWLFNGFKKDRVKYFDLTLEHLVKVIELGYWIDMEDEK